MPSTTQEMDKIPKQLVIKGGSGTKYIFEALKISYNKQRNGELPLVIYKIIQINNTPTVVKRGKVTPDFNFVNAVYVKNPGKALRLTGKSPLPLMHITVPRNPDGKIAYDRVHITGELRGAKFKHRYYQPHKFANKNIIGNNAVRNRNGTIIQPVPRTNEQKNRNFINEVIRTNQARSVLNQTINQLKNHQRKSPKKSPSNSSAEKRLIQAIKKSVLKQSERKAEEQLLKAIKKTLKTKTTATHNSRAMTTNSKKTVKRK